MLEKLLRRFFGTGLTRLVRRVVKARHLTDRYRPERHYMRGPGPKSLGQKHLEIAASDKR